MDSSHPSLASASSGQDKKEVVSGVLSELFPLPLSPFEKFVLWDESPPHAMNSFIELHFESPLNQDLLAQSLSTAVHRNPLLACRIVQRDGELCWDYDPQYVPLLQCDAQEPPLRDGWPVPIDLKRECGGRYWYSERPGGSRLMIQLHHACCDGVGLRRVMIDALTGYSRSVQGIPEWDKDKKPVWEKLNQSSLVDRFDFSRTFAGPPAKRLTTWQRIRNAHYFHFRPPTPILAKGSPDQKSPTPAAEPLRHAIIDRATSQRISEQARGLGLGINDLAIALLFQTCCRWNEQCGDKRSRSRIRILMPYDLRSRVDLRMSATNRLSFSFLGRTYAECHDLPQLLSSVQSEIKSIKQSRLPLDFLDALRFAARWPTLMKWACRRHRNMATVVLTYTGDISRGMKKYFPEQDGARLVGDVRLTNVLVAPPVRENTNISIGLCINWGQLCISAAWNRDVLTADDCEEFLASYVSAWEAWSV